MEIKKYDKVPLNQAQKNSSFEIIHKPSPQNQSSITVFKKDDINLPKTKSTVSIKNKKNSISDKSFTKEEVPIPQTRNFFIRTKENVDVKVNLDVVFHFTILELKKHSFPIPFDENKNIRLIFKGKLLPDTDLVSKSNIKVGDFIHAFISEKIEKKATSSANTTNISNFENSRSNNIRGFERMREFGINEQEMISQRFKFHSHWTLVEKEENIELTNLVNREDEWFALHLEQITGDIPNAGTWFKNYQFYDDINNELRLKGNFIEFLLGMVVGFLILILVFFIIFYKKDLSSKAKEGLVFGLVLKVVYVAFQFYLTGAMRWLV